MPVPYGQVISYGMPLWSFSSCRTVTMHTGPNGRCDFLAIYSKDWLKILSTFLIWAMDFPGVMALDKADTPTTTPEPSRGANPAVLIAAGLVCQKRGFPSG